MPLPLALVRIEFTIEQSLLSSYLVAPPFEYEDVGITSQILDPRTGRPPLPTERLLLTTRRLLTLLDVPSIIRLTAVMPWTAGAVLLTLSYWLCFACPLPILPWWLLTLWVCNGLANRTLTHTPSPWSGGGGRGGGGEAEAEAAAQAVASGHSASEAAAAERLARLEAILHPLLTALDSFASSIERTSSAPAALDPRATMLLALPIVLLAFASSFVLLPIWFLLQLVGGGANAVFTAILLAVILNALTIHQTEFYRWLGITGPHTDEEEYDEMERRGVTFADGISTGVINSERRAAAAAAVSGGYTHVSAMMGNLWRRCPDAATREHRAMARAALQRLGEGEEGGGEDAELL